MLVALVGRPNVGKSTLFNRLAQRRIAITEATPGVTRDRLYAPVEWTGRTFTLVDTGGILTKSQGEIEAAVARQAEAAILEADLVLLVLDARLGVTPEDAEVAKRLRKSGRPVLVVANKVDAPTVQPLVGELYALGLGDPFPVSAEHGRGTGDLLDAILAHAPVTGTGTPLKPGWEDSNEREPEESGESPSPHEVAESADHVSFEGTAGLEDPIRVAVVGRPNVGKSSLVNALVGHERQIVADQPGTTRDAVDIELTRDGQAYILVDTAGMRRKSRIDRGIEGLSVMRSLRAIDRAEVVVLVLDGTGNVVQEDQRIAGYIVDRGKAAVVAVNKWDAIEDREAHAETTTEEVHERLAFLSYAPIRLISARTGLRLEPLLRDVTGVAQAFRRHVPTGPLNRVLEDAQLAAAPPSAHGRPLRIYYATQVGTGPPTFAFYCNDPTLLTGSYARFIENRLRSAFPLGGTPIRLRARARRA